MKLSNIKEYKGKKILVIGLGISGKSVIKKMAGFVSHITAVDSNPYFDAGKAFDNLKKSGKFSFELITGEDVNKNKKILDRIDLVIVSPGVPNEMPLLKFADKMKIPVWSEIELGWRLLNNRQKANTIAVTGTNGKTTVATLLQKVLADAGINAAVCGNIGNPLISTIGKKGTGYEGGPVQGSLFEDRGFDDKGSDILVRVMEISSFQLERTYSFNPKVGIILNITSDHLDRHHSMNNYADIKFNLFNNAGRKNCAILNIDDPYIKRISEKRGYPGNASFKIINYSLNEASERAGIKYNGTGIEYNFGKLSGFIDVSGVSLKGLHNISNIMSVIGAAKLFGVSDKSLEKTLTGFRTLEHRIEFVGEVNKVRVYNDSKATNPDATIKALESFEREVTLILGGKDKDMDFGILLPIMDRKVVNLILIGETRVKILKILENHSRSLSGLPYNVYVCSTFNEAVEKGFKVTGRGKTLLLSPACASFDMFKDYKDRGMKFKNLVMERLNGFQF
jgi:UDP-N-acetylmuramoylalanine--D-glutamate ligase